MPRKTSYAVELRAGSPLPTESTWIGGITDQSVNVGAQVNTEVTAGSPNPRYGEIGNVIPSASFTTMDVKALLDAIGTSGECLVGATDLGFKLWALKRTACGAIDTSGSPGVHSSFTIPNGIIVPGAISAQHGTRASMTASVFSYHDGTNNPLIPAHALAAPTDDFPADENGFHLGPVSFESITMDQKTSVNVNFGITINQQIDDGDIYPSSLFRAAVRPTVSITCYDIEKFATAGAFPLTGVHATQANTSIVLRKKTLATAAYATGADHIELTIDGVATVETISASGHAPHAIQITLTGMDDGTNAMIVADTAHTLA